MITQEQKKAKELFDKFYPRATSYSLDRKNQNENAKEIASIAVNEIIKSNPRLPQTLDWQKVKTEIKNL